MLYVKRLTETAKQPLRATPGAAGYDLFCDETESVVFGPGDRALISTGIAIALDPYKVGLIWPRSGMAFKDGIDRLAGVIDSDYRGEVKVLLINHGDSLMIVHPGDRIAQLLIQPIYHDTLIDVAELPDTVRGAGGFGSTDP